MAPAQARAADPAPPATPSFGAEVSSADRAPWEFCSGIELPAATPSFGAEVSFADPALWELCSGIDLPAATPAFGAEVRLPGGGPRPLLGEASPEPPPAGKPAGEVPTAVGFADRLGADGDVVGAADFPARRGFSAAAATRSAVSRPAVSAEHSSPAGSDFLRFRRGGRLGS